MLEVPGASAELSIKSLSDCSKQKWKQLKSVLEVLRESQACSIAFQEKKCQSNISTVVEVEKGTDHEELSIQDTERGASGNPHKSWERHSLTRCPGSAG